jgi:glycosyltransferase involved in cell wall biosynthesis
MEEVYLSAVVPVYQGAAFLRDLVRELGALRASFEAEGAPVRLVEAIFVDDASVDDSFALLTQLQAEHDWVKVIPLSRNFGQHPATVAGILHSCGDWVATLDEDLQHPPKYVRQLLVEGVTKRCDVVYANPERGAHESYFRDLSSRLSKGIVAAVTGNPEVRKFNSFRLVRGGVARAAAAVSTRRTYLDVALCWFTNRIGTVTLPLRDARYITQKRSGYNLRGLLRHGRRLLLSSEIKLLRLGASIGGLALVVSVVLAAVTVCLKLQVPGMIDVPGWTSLFLTILFFGGLISLLVGIVLEYMANAYLQTLGQPTFFVVDRSKDELLLRFLKRTGEPA